MPHEAVARLVRRLVSITYVSPSCCVDVVADHGAPALESRGLEKARQLWRRIPPSAHFARAAAYLLTDGMHSEAERICGNRPRRAHATNVPATLAPSRCVLHRRHDEEEALRVSMIARRSRCLRPMHARLLNLADALA